MKKWISKKLNKGDVVVKGWFRYKQAKANSIKIAGIYDGKKIIIATDTKFEPENHDLKTMT